MAGTNIGLLERVRGFFPGGNAEKKSKKRGKTGRRKALNFEDTRPKQDLQQPKRKGPWPPERLEVIQELWGEEFLSVGGAEAVKELIRPLGLTADMSLVEIGSGIGGAVRLITTETGAWVNGYEHSATLAGLAMEETLKKGLKRKASIEHADYTKLKVRANSKDAALSKETLFTVADKDAVFGAMVKMIRPGGQLMYTDFMATGPEFKSPAIAQWQAREPRRPHLLQMAEAREKLEALGMEVRIAEDITAKYRKRALAGFNQLVEKVREFRKDVDRVKWAVLEAEIWFHRLAALDSGEVNISRIYARLPLDADLAERVDRLSPAAYRPRRPVIEASGRHESRQLAQDHQEAPPRLPRGPAPGQGVRDQQDQSPLQSPPGLTSAPLGVCSMSSADPNRLPFGDGLSIVAAMGGKRR